MSEKNPSSKNTLTIPLILSLCMNLVLIVALVVMAVTMFRSGLQSSKTETTVVETTAAETAETTDDASEDDTEEEEETYTFENADGETVEVTAYSDVYVQGEGYVCVGDQSVWDFSYDEDNAQNSVAITIDGETTSYDLSFFLTSEDDEDGSRIVVQFTNEDGTVNSLWYLQTLVDDEETDEDGNATVLGLVMESATDDTQNLLLCTPDYWETYKEENDISDESETETEETTASTETPATTETASADEE